MRYEFVEGSSSKFWDIELKGTTVRVKWGRLGTAGQTKDKTFPSPDKARAEHDKLVAEKLKKGYRAGGVAAAPAKPGKSAEPASPAKVAQKVSTTTAFFLHVSHHQFSLEDSKNTGQSFKFDSIDDGLEAQRHGVVAHLRRAAGRIPIVVEVRSEPPTSELDAFHLVAEGSFEAPSGSLEVASPEETWDGRIRVPAGWLRVQVCQADTDTSTYDGSDGADHYRVILWPSPEAKTRVLHSREVKDDVVFKPQAKLAQGEAALLTRDQTTRCLAVVDAARHLLAGEKKALALLERAAKDESDAVRAVLVSALGVLGAGHRKKVLALVGSRATDKDAEVRERVPEAFSRLGGKDGAAELLALLSSRDGVMAKTAAQLLWKVADHVEVAELVPLLGSKETQTRLAALSAVKTVGETRGWDSVAAAGDGVRALAKDKDRAVKELAAALIEHLGAPIGALLTLAKSKDPEQRTSAAKSLGKTRSPEAYELLVAMLHKDKEVGVQRAAAEGLGLLGDRRAIPHLAKHLENGVFNFNWWVAGALSKLGGTEATGWLWKYVCLPDADERFEYIGREAADRLADMLRARAQVKAGEVLNPEHSASPDLDDSVVKIATLVASGDDRLCERGLKLLEFTTDVEAVAGALSRQREEVVEQAIRTLRDMLSREGNDALNARAAKAVAPHAQAMAKLERPRLRAEWLDVLASMGGPLAWDAALAATKDAEPEVRAQAVRALGTLGPDRALEAIVSLLDDKQNNVRHAAAGALGACEKQKAGAKKALEAFLKVAKGSAKSAAQSSLRQLAGG